MRDDRKELADLLKRDADSIRGGGEFDARLHQDTMRQVRQIGTTAASGPALGWLPLKAAAAVAAAAAAACVFLFLPVHQPFPQVEADPDPGLSRAADPVSSSALVYRQAFADGDDALLTMLDRDARVLLPRSASVFQSDR